MKIASKIIAGYAAMIFIMAGLLLSQSIAIHSMQSTISRLSALDFRAARLSLELIRDRDLVEEFAKKTFADPYPGFAEKLQEFSNSFEQTLAKLQPLVRSPKARSEMQLLSQEWQRFSLDLSKSQRDSTRKSASLPAGLQDDLDRLVSRAQTVYETILSEIDIETTETRQMGRKVELISWGIAGFTLLLGCLILFTIARSISRPLNQLTAGTRAVAAGKFFYHLDASGGDEFSELARDFNTMTRRLSELDALKKDFISHVSHELKSPLASIQETIRLLLDQIPGPLTEKQKRLLQLNLQSAGRLSAMIANLLDLSRMEAGAMRYDIKKHDLAEILHTAVNEIEPNAREKSICFEVKIAEGARRIECDHDRIIQVLENLLGNAVKYSPAVSIVDIDAANAGGLPEGLPPNLRAELGKGTDASSLLMISIGDRGPGIPDDHKQKIFEKFHQIDQGRKMVGQSVGLGLAISKTIVEAHGGAIWVEDNPGGGSKFMVLLPSISGGTRTKFVSPPI
jgi:signal transduction histidine kinase